MSRFFYTLRLSLSLFFFFFNSLFFVCRDPVMMWQNWNIVIKLAVSFIVRMHMALWYELWEVVQGASAFEVVQIENDPGKIGIVICTRRVWESFVEILVSQDSKMYRKIMSVLRNIFNCYIIIVLQKNVVKYFTMLRDILRYDIWLGNILFSEYFWLLQVHVFYQGIMDHGKIQTKLSMIWGGFLILRDQKKKSIMHMKRILFAKQMAANILVSIFTFIK